MVVRNSAGKLLFLASKIVNCKTSMEAEAMALDWSLLYPLLALGPTCWGAQMLC